MAAQNFAISSLMEVDDVSLVHQNGVSYLKVKSVYLSGLGWENNTTADLRDHLYCRNWFRNIMPVAQQSNTDALEPHYFHLHLICIPPANSIFSSNELLLERIKIKAGTDHGWWSERGHDGRFSFVLPNATGNADFRVGVAKALSAFVPHSWRSSNFLPSNDQARMVDLHPTTPVDMDFEFPHAHHGSNNNNQ
jgi:hypothetical protein